MSKLIWYKPSEHCHERLFLDYIDAETKYKYYYLKHNCAYFLPQDIWKYILYLLCDDKYIDGIKVLEWFDAYSQDEYQKSVNPIRIEPTWNDALSSCMNNESNDIYYAIINVPVIFSKKYNYYRVKCPVGRAVCSIDLILGIDLGTEKLNKSVKNMYIENGYSILNDKSCPTSFTVSLSEKQTNQTFLTLKDYMPISSYSAPYSEIHFSVELDYLEAKLESINILCGYMNNKLRYKLNDKGRVDPSLSRKSFVYKKCRYVDGILFL